MSILDRLKEAGTNVAVIAFSSYILKILFWQKATLEDCVVVLALAGLYGFKLYLTSRQPMSVNKQVLLEVDKIKAAVDGLKIEKSLNRKPVKYF